MKRADALREEKRKTVTEMGGLHEERFSGSGMGVENNNEGYRGAETVRGDGSGMGSVTKKKGKQNPTTGIGASLTPDFRDKEVSVPA